MPRPTIPPALRPGDLIGVVALSAACESTRFNAGIGELEKAGYRVKIPLDPCKYYGKDDHLFSSESAKNRAKALHALFADKQVKAIISGRGAYGSAEVLPLIDFKKLAKSPKLFCGFSDSTAIMSGILAKTGMPCVHSASIESSWSKSGSNELSKESAYSLLRLLTTGESSIVERSTPTIVCGKGTGEGILIGGNLTVLSSILGTPWEPKFKGAILALEDVGEKPYRIHRLLLQMKLAGRLKSLAGVVLGSFRDCETSASDRSGPNLDRVFSDIFSEYKYPVIKGFAFGHVDLNLPLPLGIKVRISANKISNKLEFTRPIVLP